MRSPRYTRTRATSALPILFAIVATLLRGPSAAAQLPSWATAWAYPGTSNVTPIGIGIDAVGEVFASGYSVEFQFDVPPSQFIDCIGRDGGPLWIRTAITGAPNRPGGIAVDSDGSTYLVGTFTGPSVLIEEPPQFVQLLVEPLEHVIVMKYDVGGNLEWYRLLECSDSVEASGIAVTRDGIWIAGSFTGRLRATGGQIQSAGGRDVFMGLLNTDGSIRRLAREGGAANEECNALASGPDGNVTIAGLFGGTTSFGGNVLTATGPTNIYLVRYRADGSVAWARAEGGENFVLSQFAPQPLRLAVDSAGACYVAVTYDGRLRIAGQTLEPVGRFPEADAVVAKFGADGEPSWTYRILGEFIQEVRGLMVRTDGSVYASGFSQTLPEGTMFVQKISAAGEPLWRVTEARGDGQEDAAGGPMCNTPEGGIYLAGTFSGRVRFGATALESFGTTDSSITGFDMFVAELSAPSGVALGGSGTSNVRGAFFLLDERGGTLAVHARPDGPAVLDAALYSMLGQRVAHADDHHDGSLGLNTESLASGSYLVVVRTAKGIASQPFVIAR